MHSPLWSIIWLTEVSPAYFSRSFYPMTYQILRQQSLNELLARLGLAPAPQEAVCHACSGPWSTL